MPVIYSNLPVSFGGGVLKSNFPIPAVTEAKADTSDGVITLTWTDPEDEYYYPDKYDDQYPLAVWKGTKVIRKEGSKPENVNDGVLVVDSTIKNQYSEEGFTDEVEKGIAYWYAFYPYTEKGVGEPVFVEGAKFFPISWYNVDGTLFTTTMVQEGTIPAFPSDNPSDPNGGTFGGWLPAPSAVTSPASYYAYYGYSGVSETISDPWPLIHENTVNKLHSKYPIGGTKIAIFSDYGPQLMELVGRDTELTSTSSEIRIDGGLSWLAVNAFPSAEIYSNAMSKCDALQVDSYLDRIIPRVVKWYRGRGADSKASRRIWIPSASEVSIKATGDPALKAEYTIKNMAKGVTWWTSSYASGASGVENYYVVTSNGNQSTQSGKTEARYAPGFCTN